MVGTFNPCAHFIRSACETFHGLALRSMPLKAVLQLLRELAFHHRQVAANFQNIAHRFIANGTNIHARAAGGASPDRLLRNQIPAWAHRSRRHNLSDNAY